MPAVGIQSSQGPRGARTDTRRQRNVSQRLGYVCVRVTLVTPSSQGVVACSSQRSKAPIKGESSPSPLGRPASKGARLGPSLQVNTIDHNQSTAIRYLLQHDGNLDLPVPIGISTAWRSSEFACTMKGLCSTLTTLSTGISMISGRSELTLLRQHLISDPEKSGQLEKRVKAANKIISPALIPFPLHFTFPVRSTRRLGGLHTSNKPGISKVRHQPLTHWRRKYQWRVGAGTALLAGALIRVYTLVTASLL